MLFPTDVLCSETVELCRRAVHAGVSWITIHGRTPAERCQPVNVDAIRLIADCLNVPIIANGDVKSLSDAETIQTLTGASGQSVWQCYSSSRITSGCSIFQEHSNRDATDEQLAQLGWNEIRNAVIIII